MRVNSCGLVRVAGRCIQGGLPRHPLLEKVDKFVCHIPLMPRGQSLSFASPKASNQRKGDPDDWPDPAMLRKKRNRKNSLRSDSFSF